MKPPADDAPAPIEEPPPRKGGRRRLLLLAAPVLLAAAAGGLFLSGALSGGRRAEQAEAAPTFVDLPEIVSNLNGNPRRPSYLKLRAKLELARASDAAAVAAAMPRVLDLFQTYLREARPEELRGSAGIYRLREELIARTSLAVAPVRVQDVLFTEMLVQ